MLVFEKILFVKSKLSSDKISEQINNSIKLNLASKQIFISLIPSTTNDCESFLLFAFDKSFLMFLNKILFLLSICFKIIS
jgi:hypothetical protein